MQPQSFCIYFLLADLVFYNVLKFAHGSQFSVEIQICREDFFVVI